MPRTVLDARDLSVDKTVKSLWFFGTYNSSGVKHTFNNKHMVLVSITKYHKLDGRTTETCCPPVLQVRGLKPRHQQGWFLLSHEG